MWQIYTQKTMNITSITVTDRLASKYIPMRKALKYSLFIFPFLMVATACEDSGFLDRDPYSTTPPENYYQTLGDFETALVGCYDAINMGLLSGDNVSEGTYMTGLQYMLSGGNDELVLNPDGGGQDREAFGIASYNAVNTAVGDLWKAYYAGIQRCNFLLDKAGEITFGDEEDEARLTEIVAETRFLRAFFYHHLALLFGGVPLNTSPEADPSAPRENLETIYTGLIIPDLEFAYETLPETASTGGRADKWSAAGYIGVIYNYLAACKRNGVGDEMGLPLNSFGWVDAGQMSQDAKAVLGDIVNNSHYHLIERYDYLFREGTKSYQQEECLFTAENALEITDTYPNIAQAFCPGGNRNMYGGSWSTYRPTAELFFSYNDSLDIRRSHNITSIYNAESATEEIEGATYYVPLATTDPASWRNGTGKYRHMAPGEKPIPVWASGISIPLLRYADILLQYAEALYFTGDETTARTYFTRVRERIVAEGVSVEDLDQAYYKQDFTEELLDERKRELCYESKRRVDLIRFGKMAETIRALDPDAGFNNTRVRDLQANWKDKDYKIWFPIPQREMDLNPNLVQNAGY